ncbi:unnamed protein product [Calicophoron daubneyi]|uniref:Uncharacterized protein n=1 Tax=Calicophoron daubneyi TaxID=300641 RepID=A0AAV2T1V9_CALDB
MSYILVEISGYRRKTDTFLSPIRLNSVTSILVIYVAADSLVNEADFVYHQFEGRCVGYFQEEKASFATQPSSKPLAVLEGLNNMKLSCAAACRLHSQCWSSRVTVNTNGTKVCLLYGKDVLKLDPAGFWAYLWHCEPGEFRCRSTGPDRCPGFWMVHFMHKIVKAELDEITKGVLSDKDRGPCGPVRLSKLESTECKLACRTERYCSTVLYRPEISEYDYWEMSNGTKPSVCKLLDVNDRFPKYAEQGQPQDWTSGEVISTDDLRYLLSMPYSWLVGSPPYIAKWTCCKNWWTMIDMQSDKIARYNHSCLRENGGHRLLDQPDSLAAMINNCSGPGYWKTVTVQSALRPVIPTQSLMKNEKDFFLGHPTLCLEERNRSLIQHVLPLNVEIVLINLFKTQNPLDCPTECTENPCCVRPAYLPKRWICILFGAATGYPVCTSKLNDQFEWSTAWDINDLPGDKEPVMTWQFVCCPTKVGSYSDTRPMETVWKTTINSESGLGVNQSESSVDCLCNSSSGQRVELKTVADLFCPEKLRSMKKELKFATHPTALIVDRTRQMVRTNNDSGEWVGYASLSEIDRVQRNRSEERLYWVPVITTLYPDLHLWAGPLHLLKRCPILHCRVHVDNEFAQGDHKTTRLSGVGWDRLESALVKSQDWFAPRCPNNHPPKTFKSKPPINMVVVHNYYIPRSRCYTLASCSFSLRQAALYHISRGWGEIGYNYVIGNDGRIYECRGKKYAGAHTLGHNDVSYGVAFPGWYPNVAPTIQSVSAFWNLLSVLRNESALSNHIQIYGSRDLSTSEDPGLALNYLIHTFPQSFDGIRNTLEGECLNEQFEPSVVVIIGGAIAALLLVTLSVIVRERKKKGFMEEMFLHTTSCEVWHDICKRVAKEQGRFGILSVLERRRFVDNAAYNDSNESLICTNFSNTSTLNARGKSFGESSAVANSNYEDSVTRVKRIQSPDFQTSVPSVIGTQNYKTDDSEALMCNIKLISANEFLRGYSRIAPIRIHFACDPKTSTPELRYSVELFSLFCRSWKELLDKRDILPCLFLSSLNAICTQALKANDGICVKLVTNSLDFLVLLCSAPQDARQDLLIELLSDQRQLVPLIQRNSLLGFGRHSKKILCRKCGICRPLPSLYQYSTCVQSSPPIARILRLRNWSALSRLRSVHHHRNCISKCPLSTEFWMRFTDKQRKYAELINSPQGGIVTYNEYCVLCESQFILRG